MPMIFYLANAQHLPTSYEIGLWALEAQWREEGKMISADDDVKPSVKVARDWIITLKNIFRLNDPREMVVCPTKICIAVHRSGRFHLGLTTFKNKKGDNKIRNDQRSQIAGQAREVVPQNSSASRGHSKCNKQRLCLPRQKPMRRKGRIDAIFRGGLEKKMTLWKASSKTGIAGGSCSWVGTTSKFWCPFRILQIPAIIIRLE
ncbi:hypothetical protein BC936DRAFT_149404 [Jimgerdemannia flammicorona]|uniref:Uncharacterized protein n=1 Tax=Jimgerdemannia flammicorona TaxID=994334 RepID=A0A433D0X4_9FUNG|nr:hypothetical protein BC936DRAFT_149404 [Jimgerdemannia flammicorona]